MLLSVRIVKAIVLLTTTVSGLFMNSSIVAEYGRTWGRRHQPVEHIIFSTAVTNVLLQCSVTLDGFLYVFNSYVTFVEEVYVMDFAVLYFLIELSFWHAAWLSIYYCLKLVNHHNHFYSQMKLHFFSCIPGLLIGSTVGSLLINVPFLWTLQITVLPNGTDYNFNMVQPHKILNMIFGCLVPFLLTFTSIVLSVCSLLSHVLRVKRKESNFRRPQLKAHMGAVRTMVTRLILDLILCLVSAGLLTSQLTLGLVVDTACWVLVMCYSTFQSIIFIQGNPKLKTKLFTCNMMK
ncbi:hypothetical protein GDO81_027796 [Engystomops pustulosus]|uniref:Taste receptor type 2 n=1 Tax=Engystomops pustulosus TaxID=76066 RepID=A0AAV6ZLH4_ENGPU|nr:hypothetical protein GDO81_027796 [Engystomops pustulosus]